MNFVTVFPQFGKASDPSAETAALPYHGFARISKFKLTGTNDSKSAVSVSFGKKKRIYLFIIFFPKYELTTHFYYICIFFLRIERFSNR